MNPSSPRDVCPSLSTNVNRGHSRQASKTSLLSNYSTTSFNPIINEKNLLRLVYQTKSLNIFNLQSNRIR